jgi:hypothetical protein
MKRGGLDTGWKMHPALLDHLLIIFARILYRASQAKARDLLEIYQQKAVALNGGQRALSEVEGSPVRSRSAVRCIPPLVVRKWV